ncbi:AAA family ATPase [Pseudomonas putida]|uniref:AAA family ATPase n=1 Tax=Pseudomonas putida TaxID=303 RepID=UPI003906C750
MHIGIFGLSGAGKTTLARSFSNLDKRLEIISASTLIKEWGGRIQYHELGRDRVSSNQSMLVDAYREFKAIHQYTVIELHSVIETEEGVIEIDTQVLRGLELDLGLFLKIDPAILVERRRMDSTKKRRVATALELELLQERAIGICKVALGDKLKLVSSELAFQKVKEALSIG